MMYYPHEFEYNLEDVIHSTIKTCHTYSAQLVYVGSFFVNSKGTLLRNKYIK